MAITTNNSISVNPEGRFDLTMTDLLNYRDED